MRELYQNQTFDASIELFFKDRDTRKETKPAVASGTFMLIGVSGQTIVPLTTTTISATNKSTFRYRPTSGTATIGSFKEVWEFFIGGESHLWINSLIIKERY